MIDDRSRLKRAKEYAKSRGLGLKAEGKLGYGTDGTVWRTSAKSALKVLDRELNYRDELTCYQRLASASVREIRGLSVPRLLNYDHGLLAIEMSIVQPPYLLDFGKVYIDRPPPYFADSQLMANMHVEGRENFGKKWPRVIGVVTQLRDRFGIYYVDPKPGNINFGEDEAE